MNKQREALHGQRRALLEQFKVGDFVEFKNKVRTWNTGQATVVNENIMPAVISVETEGGNNMSRRSTEVRQYCTDTELDFPVSIVRRDLALPGHLGPLARKLDHLSEDDPVRESTNLVAEQHNLTKVRVDDRDRLRLIQEWAQRVLPNPCCVSELQDLVEATMEVGNVVKTMTVPTNKNALPKAQRGILREMYVYSPFADCTANITAEEITF